MSSKQLIVVTENFYEVLQTWKENEFSNDVIFNLGQTPQAIQNIGAKPLPVLVTGKTLSKAFFDHGIVLRLLSQIPDWLDKPVQIYRSATVAKGSVVVLSSSFKNGDPIIVPIEMDTYIDRLPTNRIKSVYTKPQGIVDKWEMLGLRLK